MQTHTPQRRTKAHKDPTDRQESKQVWETVLVQYRWFVVVVVVVDKPVLHKVLKAKDV